MTFACNHFKKLKCYQYSNNPSFSTVIPWREKDKISMTLLMKNSGTGGKGSKNTGGRKKSEMIY
jgi:hypothetical protein